MHQLADDLLNPIIRVELKGGLGNQLFQAATAYALALRLNGSLQLDVSRYRTGAARGYDLRPFNHGGTVTAAAANPLRRLNLKIIKTLTGQQPGPHSWHGEIFTENNYSFDPRINSISGSCYLRGYFQSYRYFARAEELIRAAFDPGTGASPAAKAFGKKIGADVIALHVRGGDFLTNPRANAVHGTLTKSYYEKSLQIAREARPAARILVFSDNMKFAASILPNEEVTHVEGFTAHDDLYLMSCAHSHIIANSTFSYFSGWLDPRPNPLVIAPKEWISPTELKKTTIQDLYPPSWILV